MELRGRSAAEWQHGADKNPGEVNGSPWIGVYSSCETARMEGQGRFRLRSFGLKRSTPRMSLNSLTCGKVTLDCSFYAKKLETSCVT